MRFESSIDIAAPAEHVFSIYSDVERWPEWLQTVTSVERLDEGPLRVGSRTRIRQPRLPVAVWEVDEIVPDRSFIWVAHGPGIVTTGSHVVTPLDGDKAKATASLEQAGVLGSLMGRLTKRLTDEYLETEVRSLKSRCEA